MPCLASCKYARKNYTRTISVPVDLFCNAYNDDDDGKGEEDVFNIYDAAN